MLDSYECGIVLKGAEVKSIRNGHANLQDGVRPRRRRRGLAVRDAHARRTSSHAASSTRSASASCLLHRKEIVALTRATEDKGTTLVPLRVYFKDGRCKIELAVARGKARYDKRQAIAKRDADRETERTLKELNR